MLDRRKALWAAAALTIGVAGGATAWRALGAGAPRLYVFVPTLVRPNALLSLLEGSLRGVEITVFGRFADFQSAVATLRPDAAISLGQGLEAVGLSPTLQGTGTTGPYEPYVVLSPQRYERGEQLLGLTLGVVDMVGRRSLPSLVQTLLGLSTAPKVRRVLKLADLLPLLSLRLADGIVIPERFLQDFQKASEQNLYVFSPQKARLLRAAVAFPRGADQLITGGLQSLSPSAFAALGVQKWERVP